MILPIFLATIVVILIVAGQVLWKLGSVGQIQNFETFFKTAMSPMVILGAIFYALAGAVWMFALSNFQYHRIYPLLSLSFVLALIASRFILHEEVSWLSWLGVLIICFGVIIIGFGNK